MKGKIITNALLLIYAFLVVGMTQPRVGTNNEAPTFKKYNVENVYEGRHADIKYTTPIVLKYKNQLQKAEKGKVNFAGHYIITPISCGNECRVLAIIDSANGKVYMPQPYDEYSRGKNKILNWSFLGSNRKIIKYEDPNFFQNQISFMPNSNLLILAVDYHKDYSAYPRKTLFYVWEDNKLYLIKTVKNAQPQQNKK
jgi:hypothetical protein